MAFKNCIRCNKLIFDLNKICLECRDREEEEQRLVTAFLRDHPGSSIPQIHEATGVKEAVIMSLIRKGHIVADGVTLQCSVCGKDYPGSKNLMCPACTAKMDKQLASIAPPAKPAAPEPGPKKPKSPGGRDDQAFSTIRKTRLS